MKLIELLVKANQGYPDGYLSEYYDENGHLKEGSGDSLARHIVVEITETVDEGWTDEDQIAEVVRALRHSVEEIEGVIEELERGR